MMAVEKTVFKANCMDCGRHVDIYTVWIDNSGPLCSNCAIRKRIERMHPDILKSSDPIPLIDKRLTTLELY